MRTHIALVAFVSALSSFKRYTSGYQVALLVAAALTLAGGVLKDVTQAWDSTEIPGTISSICWSLSSSITSYLALILTSQFLRDVRIYNIVSYLLLTAHRVSAVTCVVWDTRTDVPLWDPLSPPPAGTVTDIIYIVHMSVMSVVVLWEAFSSRATHRVGMTLLICHMIVCMTECGAGCLVTVATYYGLGLNLGELYILFDSLSIVKIISLMEVLNARSAVPHVPKEPVVKIRLEPTLQPAL